MERVVNAMKAGIKEKRLVVVGQLILGIPRRDDHTASGQKGHVIKAQQFRNLCRSLRVQVPTDTLTLVITVVDTDSGWRVSGYDRE